MSAKDRMSLDGLSPSVENEIAFRRMYPALYRWACVDSNDAQSVRLTQRGMSDWLAMAKGYDDQGGPVICFASGSTFLDALKSLEGGLASGRWRVDKPYKPSQ